MCASRTHKILHSNPGILPEKMSMLHTYILTAARPDKFFMIVDKFFMIVILIRYIYAVCSRSCSPCLRWGTRLCLLNGLLLENCCYVSWDPGVPIAKFVYVSKYVRVMEYE